ncbi:hypothetical protein L211DRAFT_851794 [Terfezia boudieri ATCC MYA-4762]|uniref:RNA polymerase II degradation factor 1 n=1 Tax=Terfezia boudieri ATCC MYA-4762 TaxID=1051890 RepID=A0A3N4LDT8_9PEZI|nr:hypothetical protein L211DRAFT_851794 [Terfezia boudieri ATCC MYA-4762]
MSEVQHRPPPRGRGLARGGRGGFGSRGSRFSRMDRDSNASSFEDQGEIGQLKQQYAEKLKTVKEILPDWTDEDIVFALQEAQGDVEATVTRMSEGSIPQWGEVKKKKQDRSRSKIPEIPAGVATAAGRGRGRGSDIPRGNRGGRATDRGGRPGRGRGGTGAHGQWASTNDDSGKRDGTDDSTGEDGPASKPDAKVLAVNNVPAPPGKPKDTWAALLRPTVPPPAPKKVAPPSAPPKPPVVEPTPTPPQVEELQEPEPTPETTPAESLPLPPPPATEPALPEPEEAPKPTESEPEPEPEPEPVAPEAIVSPPEPEVAEPPEIKTEEPPVETTHQPLTEQNLEKVEDVAPAAPTGTQASTINSSVAATRTPEALAPATPRARHVGLSTPKISSARTASFSRRTLEQQEAVIMPGNHAIDRTTVQFGSLGLNGAAIDDDDYESEPTQQKPETVTQPPQSPPTEPVTVLPPAAPQPQAPQQAPPAQVQVQTPQVQQPIQPPVQQQVQPQIPTQQQPQPPHQEALPTPRQAPGLPAQPQVQAQMQHQQQPSPQPPLAPQSMTSQHMNPQISSQFNRFGGIDQTQAAQKPYDSFQQHVPQQHTPQTQAAQLPQLAQSQQAQQQSYGYPTHHQQQQHHQQSHPAQASLGGLTSLPDYNYYNSDIQRTGAPGFSYYNTNPYSQPNQDTVSSLPRAASGMGSAAGETASQLPTAPSQAASRFGQVGEQTSVHGTPSPGIPTLQPTSQAPNPQQTAAHQQYPMQPYYHPGYYYMNQVFNYDAPYSGTSELSEGFSSYQQFYPTYQAPFAKQQGLYTQPHQNFQYSDHTSSPAGLGGFGGPTTQGRDSGSGVSDYGRGGVSQAQQTHPQHSSANFAGLPNFLHSRGLPEQQQLGSGVGQQQVAQQGQSDDNLKPFGDSKPPTGPASNAGLQGQPRPGSATSGANLPQQGSQPQGGMGYPHNLNHHLHGHQAHQQSQHSVAQGQGYGGYSMYGQYPSQYQTASNRQGASGWGGQYGGH